MQDKAPEYGSDVIFDTFRAMGIKFVSLNPGATTRGLHDSIVNYGGNKNPELILCCHEGIAVAIASGYFRATHQPMVVLLHDIAGLLHATKAIFDAWINRDAMIVIGGNGPVDIQKRRPWIDWIHNALIPNTMVRDFVKWDDQPSDLFATLEDLIRSRGIALTEPTGPVFISIDAGIQEAKLEAIPDIPKPESHSFPSVDEGSVAKLSEAAKVLSSAEHPVIITNNYGRDDNSIANLVDLAQQLGAIVLDSGARFNFPNTNPLNLSGLEESTLAEADVVLALGVKDLYFHLARRDAGFYSRLSTLMIRPDCEIIRIDLEGFYQKSWVSEYGRLTPTSLYIPARPDAAVVTLLELCRKELQSLDQDHEIKARISVIKDRYFELRKKWRDIVSNSLNKHPPGYPALAAIAWETLRDKDWVLAFPGYSMRGINAWLRRTWEITRCYQYPGRGEGTGTGTGQALGVALANVGKFCIDFQPDGDLLYSASSLWTAAHCKIPLLIIMMNDRSYHNDEEHNKFISMERNRSEESSKIGIRIEEPNVDFGQMARSFGIGSSGVVDTANSLREALKEGASVVSKGRPYLVDVLVQQSQTFS